MSEDATSMPSAFAITRIKQDSSICFVISQISSTKQAQKSACTWLAPNAHRHQIRQRFTQVSSVFSPEKDRDWENLGFFATKDKEEQTVDFFLLVDLIDIALFTARALCADASIHIISTCCPNARRPTPNPHRQVSRGPNSVLHSSTVVIFITSTFTAEIELFHGKLKKNAFLKRLCALI